MKKFIKVTIMAVLASAIIGLVGFGSYLYLTNQPSCQEMLETKGENSQFTSMTELESKLTECGYSRQEIAIWHIPTFATSYEGGFMPTISEEEQSLANPIVQKKVFTFFYNKWENIPSIFRSVDPKCRGQVKLRIIQEVYSDQSHKLTDPNISCSY